MKKKSFHLKDELVSSMEIPRDLAYRDAIITLTGNNKLCIENYRSILEYTENCISILMAKGRLRVTGRRLELLYYTNDEMLISGHIQEVIFTD